MYSVLLPTYNESENIQILVYLLRDTFDEMSEAYELIIVDDGSTDGTIKKIKHLEPYFPIKFIQRKEKLGLGSAYKEALKNISHESEFIVIMDADLSHDPKAIKDMAIAIKEADVVVATRYTLGGIVGWNFKRKMISRGANNLAQIITGVEVTDLTNSYRMYRRNVLENLEISSNGFSFQMEAIVRAYKKKYKIMEVPIIFHERKSGKSKMGIIEIIRFIQSLIVLFFVTG
ncbi:Dolichol-phosphate mannosyltransferase [Spraguea lophii 42_110]|uniref:Dolichol-phosphate mannosyltransferase subunit 1 n=1 Tax=Spraguea lophii (strain 42_110) TaxID=1358809 RepID=S7W929_SPRLO|nr:Dolichol-phosphate mannosyltransferase [Spraguea lophii 42_110]